MIVALNKIDLIPPEKRAATIERVSKRLLKTFESTKFAGSHIIPVIAKKDGEDAADSNTSANISQLIETLKKLSFRPERDPSGAFLCAVDHCFPIRGQGTVMTGTILSGHISVNDVVEIPTLKISKKVKSLQMFKKQVDSAVQGDRIGMCVTQFDSKLLERGLIGSVGSLPVIYAAITSANRIAWYKENITTKAKFHISVCHDTVMGRVSFFGLESDDNKQLDAFDFNKDYLYEDELLSGDSASHHDGYRPSRKQFVLIEFEKPLICPTDSLVIGSKLDVDIHANSCRLAFHGRILVAITEQNYADTVLPKLRVYKNKMKDSIVERQTDDYTLVCKGLFKKESNIDAFRGLKVKLSTGENGVIEGGFGQSGKFKVRLSEPLTEATKCLLTTKSGRKGQKDAVRDSTDKPDEIKVILTFKHYMYSKSKRMVQD